jgi:hypothetical protein
MSVPVQRFRTPEDAARALWTRPGDPGLGRRIRSLWEMSARLAPPRAVPRGVRRFHSIEEANRERAAWSTCRLPRSGSQPG